MWDFIKSQQTSGMLNAVELLCISFLFFKELLKSSTTEECTNRKCAAWLIFTKWTDVCSQHPDEEIECYWLTLKVWKSSVFSCLAAQSCPILCYPVDCSLPGSPVHGILQARILEWITISFSTAFSYFWFNWHESV